MTRRARLRSVTGAFALWILLPPAAYAQAPVTPPPLSLADVVRLAPERRDEVAAARARTRAADARTTIASALADPMISPSIDHLPFMFGGADVSVTIEQQIPLSGIRRHRRDAARADVDRLSAQATRATLDVAQEAAIAFVMLLERRRTGTLLREQLGLARGLVGAANARYASGTAPQSDVLRAELEVARLEAFARGLTAEIRSAEAMLSTSIGRDADAPVPELVPPTIAAPIPSWAAIKSALPARPELAAGRAEVARAESDIRVMQDMFRPMATIRTGPSYTMSDGKGWMAMVGVSLPLWRGKLRAGVAEAQEMRAVAEGELRAMTRMVDADAAVAAAQAQAATDRYTALKTDVLPRARMAIDPAVAGYASGRLPLVSVIEAVQALWLVQSDLIAADSQLALAWTRLGRALGSFEAIFQ